MNEAETQVELIDPKLKACGWGVVEGSKILREYNIIAGKILTSVVPRNAHLFETKKLEAIYQQKLLNLEELKKSILHKAFNGEL
jgi:hypothetical protein